VRLTELDEMRRRIDALEQQVAELKATVRSWPVGRDWRRAVGMFGDDPIMKEILNEAMKYREADRERTRRRFARLDHAKKQRKPREPAKRK